MTKVLNKLIPFNLIFADGLFLALNIKDTNGYDKDGNKVEYTGTIKVTYTLPDDWNLNYGIKALTVSGSSLGDYKFLR